MPNYLVSKSTICPADKSIENVLNEANIAYTHCLRVNDNMIAIECTSQEAQKIRQLDELYLTKDEQMDISDYVHDVIDP